MKKLLFGNDVQARTYAEANDLILDKKPTSINVVGFESEEGAPDTYSGECNAFVARDAQDNEVAYLAYWETKETIEESEAILILKSLYNKEDGSLYYKYKYYYAADAFKDYVSEFCEERGIKEEAISEQELTECAYNFINYDRGDYYFR